MASPDANLEHLIIHIIGLALPQSYVTTFDEFRTFDVDDVYEFQYSSMPKVSPDTKLQFMLVKQVQRCIHYACYKEEKHDLQSDDPTLWSKTEYSTWSRNRYPAYLATLAPAAVAPLPVTSMTATSISPTQKDDQAALISWNRNPRNVAKYLLLKNAADYQDWKLKMKGQLIANTLSRVTDPTFIITNCRAGADMELAMLHINFFEQILSAVLLNPGGKGLVITHPEDALFVWKQHEAHQTDSNSAQISTAALMNKLMTLKIADSPTRHSFLVSFQEVCNRYVQLADVKLADSFKRTLLQASIMHDTALLNSWKTVNKVKHATNPSAPSATYSEFYTFLVTQAKTHDIAIPFKRSTCHAHKANFDSFSDDNNECEDDEDSVLDEVIAHMSVQNEPMSEETVNALQVFSTFQRQRNGPACQRDPEAEIPPEIYRDVSRELKSAWSHDNPKIKKRILQCKQGAKKNAELGIYMIEVDGYNSESDASAYLEATYGYDADDTCSCITAKTTTLRRNPQEKERSTRKK
jgi:hypothetical protein